jgi:hypothetical protein
MYKVLVNVVERYQYKIILIICYFMYYMYYNILIYNWVFHFKKCVIKLY